MTPTRCTMSFEGDDFDFCGITEVGVPCDGLRTARLNCPMWRKMYDDDDGR